MSVTISQLVAKVRTVYSLPQTFHRLQEVVQNPDSSMSDIGEVLMADQALSARILQLANSSFYGFPSRIETISHAVTMIGAEQMVALVQGTCVASIFNRDYPVIQAYVLLVGVLFVFFNLFFDILQYVADPRLRERKA